MVDDVGRTGGGGHNGNAGRDDPRDRDDPASRADRERQLREVLGQVFGADAEQMFDQMTERGIDPLQVFGGADRQLPTAFQMQAALAQIRRLLAEGGDSPVNAAVAHDMARQTSVTGGDPVVSAAEAKAVMSAFSTAELWLDVATSLGPSPDSRHAWSRAQWVEATLPAWNRLVAPVATSMAEAMAQVLEPGEGFASDLTDSDEAPLGPLAALGLGGLAPRQLLRKLGATAYGVQVGQAAGTLSREVFGATDLGLPLLADASLALLPANVQAFATGLDISLEEVRAYLAVREAAHARLFARVPWLRSHLLGLVESYARGITVDLGALEDQMRGVDPTSGDQIRRAMSGGGFFQVTPSDEQLATLLRLETALALVEGWVDEVTTQATRPQLPHSEQLREMLRRRRAAGGPAEQAFASIVGLDLRPRRARDAARLFGHVFVARGAEGRDALWLHPDLLPGPGDLDDPAGFLARQELAASEFTEVDAALAQIFGEGDESAESAS